MPHSSLLLVPTSCQIHHQRSLPADAGRKLFIKHPNPIFPSSSPVNMLHVNILEQADLDKFMP
jgi:hypothetical protein